MSNNTNANARLWVGRWSFFCVLFVRKLVLVIYFAPRNEKKPLSFLSFFFAPFSSPVRCLYLYGSLATRQRQKLFSHIRWVALEWYHEHKHKQVTHICRIQIYRHEHIEVITCFKYHTSAENINTNEKNKKIKCFCTHTEQATVLFYAVYITAAHSDICCMNDIVRYRHIRTVCIQQRTTADGVAMVEQRENTQTATTHTLANSCQRRNLRKGTNERKYTTGYKHGSLWESAITNLFVARLKSAGLIQFRKKGNVEYAMIVAVTYWFLIKFPFSKHTISLQTINSFEWFFVFVWLCSFLACALSNICISFSCAQQTFIVS